MCGKCWQSSTHICKSLTFNHLGIIGSHVLPVSLYVHIDRKILGVMEMWMFQMRKEKDVEECVLRATAYQGDLRWWLFWLWCCALLIVGPVPQGISKAKVRDEMQRLRGRKAAPQIEAWCLEKNIHKGTIRHPNSSLRSALDLCSDLLQAIS